MPHRNPWPTNRLLSTAARLVEYAWNEELASLGVTHAGVMALDVLRCEGSMTQAQLAHQVRVQAQTMGKTLHRLESHGHVTRARSERDRRSHVVSISPAGEQVLADAASIEQDLLGGDDGSDEQFRCRLMEIISTLGGARWRMEVQEDRTACGADASGETGVQDAGARGAGAQETEGRGTAAR